MCEFDDRDERMELMNRILPDYLIRLNYIPAKDSPKEWRIFTTALYKDKPYSDCLVEHWFRVKSEIIWGKYAEHKREWEPMLKVLYNFDGIYPKIKYFDKLTPTVVNVITVDVLSDFWLKPNVFVKDTVDQIVTHELQTVIWHGKRRI